MILIYTPAGGDERRWNYKPAELPTSEAEAIEEATGVTFDEFHDKLLRGWIPARRALLWMLRRRDEPGLAFTDVRFNVGELVLEFDADEKAQGRVEVEKSTELSPDQRRQLLEALADDGEGEVGKDPSTPDGPSAAGG